MREAYFVASAVVCAVAVAVVVIWLTGPPDMETLQQRADDWIASHCTHAYRFDPQPDITPYQLAQILAHGSVSSPICEDEQHPVPEDIRSQLRVIK